MSQRTWQPPASLPGPPSGRRDGASGISPGRQARSAAPAPKAPAAPRLTGRGAMLGMFALCFAGVVVSGWLHWGAATGGTFVVAYAFAAARTQRGDLLTVAVSGPALFLLAVICGKALMSSGGLLLSTTEGTLITLTNTAPWLVAGTVLSLIIAFARGLWGNVRALGAELRGDPTRSPRAPGSQGRQSP